jgi:1-acyl-sn-glycerol-3-phosphate acyltransferase
MLKWIGNFYLRLVGWKLSGQPPAGVKKWIILAAPHTSNWDLPLMLAMSFIYGIRVHWMGKHTLFMFPFGGLMRFLGGISIDRRSKQNTVQQMTEAFRKADSLILCIPAEGTRKRTEYWKSGFYHIARSADVPIVLGFLDYKRKIGGLADPLAATGDVKADMDKIRAFYAGMEGKYPKDFGPIRLKEEEAAPVA